MRGIVPPGAGVAAVPIIPIAEEEYCSYVYCNDWLALHQHIAPAAVAYQ